MSSTGAPEGPADGTAEDQEYFRTLEEAFLDLRGSTTLLGAEDWRTASRWRRLGIPAELVVAVMEALFARQRERKSKRGISSLRYFRAAVESAWDERLAHLAGAGPAGDPGPPTRDRLAALATALPQELPGREELEKAVLALGGEPSAVEERLTEIEKGVLQRLLERLSADERRELEGRVARMVDRTAGASPPEELEQVRERLRAQAVRARFGLPVLSLFSPAALGPARDEVT